MTKPRAETAALLGALAGVVRLRESAESEERALVARLRALDPPVSWELIATVYGQSRQSVQYRFRAGSSKA